MERLTQSFHNGYKYLLEDLANPITKKWFMVGNPAKIFTVIGIYIFFCLKLGPWFMKFRKPYDLKNIMKIYNIFQILLSLYLLYEGSVYIFFNDFNICCQGLHDANTPTALRIANTVWLYYMVKLIDLLDTIFFVLRKSDRQISSLHLHHHSLMPVVSWYASTFHPGGQGVILGTINALVHAVMYTYYLIAGLGDKYKKYLWWKNYLTILQLVQFVIIGVHSINSIFYECSYPQYLKYITIGYAVVFLNMFGQFYYRTYIKNTNSEEIKMNETYKPKKEINRKTH